MIDPTTSAVVGALIGSTVASAVKGAKGPAQFIDDLMQVTGFGKFNQFANESRARQELSENAYKLEIAAGVNNIPDEFQQVPKLSIIGPAIEASKFYIEEDILRSMFANIISSSIDSRQNGKVHQSFVEIAKQLSFDDAKHIRQMYDQEANPIISIHRRLDVENGTISIINNLFLSDHLNLSDYQLIGSSIINLKRLGLIDIPPMVNYTTKSHYDSLRNNHFTLSVIRSIEANGKCEIKEGLIEITALGLSFCKVCL